MIRIITLTIVFLAALLAQGTPALAASPTSCEILGNVTDIDRNLVAGAVVRLTDTRTGQVRTKRVNARGHFRFGGVRADALGHQTIEIFAENFETQIIRNATCPVGNAMRTRVRMTPTRTSQSVVADILDTSNSQKTFSRNGVDGVALHEMFR